MRVSSTKHSFLETSTSLDRSGSSPGGFIVKHVPVENGPSISMCSMPAFQIFQPGTSRKMLQMMAGLADVSIAYSPRQTSFSLMIASIKLCAHIICTHSITVKRPLTDPMKQLEWVVWREAQLLVMAGLDPAIHPFRKASCEDRWIRGSSPRMTNFDAA